MKGFFGPIEDITTKNNSFRKVLYTGDYTQLVVMSLLPGESIGLETHGNDQFFRFESGSGEVAIDNETYTVQDGDCVLIPAGARHNVTNTSSNNELKLYTLYSPPHHADGTVHDTKEDAQNSNEEFDGVPSE